MKELHIQKDYEINPYTLAVISHKGDDGKIKSLILENDSRFIVDQRPIVIIDQSCKYFGSSLKGRQEGTKEVAGITHKPPIAVDPTSGIYMFPTTSPNKRECAWLSHTYISSFDSVGLEQTLVRFTNNEEYILENVSKGSFENQLNRTAQFRYLLSQRIYQGNVKDFNLIK